MLEQIRVLEVGGGIAPSLASMLLADLGADVVKVEPAEDDPSRGSPAFETWNRGKRMAALNFADPNGRATLEQLALAADVVVLGVAPWNDAFALDSAALLDQRPDLIVCELPPFADEMGHVGLASEGVIAAAAGLYRPTLTPGEFKEPIYTPLPFASTYAGVVAATSIAAALYARDRSGRGQVISIPIHSAIFLAIGFSLLRVDGADSMRTASRTVNPLVTTYECGDGRWIQLHAATPKFIQGLIEAMGLESWRTEGLLDASRWPAEPGLVVELHNRLKERFLSDSAEAWETFLSDAGLCCAVCRTVEEWVSHEHATASGMSVVVDTGLGPMHQPGPIVRVDGEAPPIPKAAIRTSTEGLWAVPVARTWGTSDLRHPLDGIRVLDLCLILAGPTCGRTLAEFGADVIKIDGPSPTVIESFWMDTNRGKRSVVLDLSTDEGQEVLWKLIDTADVVVENFRRGVAEKLGIGYSQVAARRPDIVYASMNCYGYAGPFADRPGWEQLAQAVSGMQTRYGGRDSQPMLAPYAVNDYVSGLSAALGVLAALHEREKTGRGKHVTSALAASAGILQSLYMFDFPGYQRHEIEGKAAKGLDALQRLYRCQDQWVYFDCPREQWNTLSEVADFAPVATAEATDFSSKELTERVASILSTRDASEWRSMLVPKGIGVEPVLDLDALRASERVRAAGLVCVSHNEEGREIEHIGIPHRLSGTPAFVGGPAPVLGQHTGPILEELGYTTEQIVRLFEEGVAGGG